MASGKTGRTKTGENSHTVLEMAGLLERSGIRFSDKQLELLWSYHGLLRRYNTKLNLTRVRNFTEMVLKLYIDSILPGTMVDLPSPLMDLGTGPGMPGIPLKIFFPHLDVWLAEGRGKRAAFLQAAVMELGLDGVKVIGRNISRTFEEPVGCVITRAVESISSTLERIEGCLLAGGKAVFMKGPSCDPEVEQAVKKFKGHYRLEADYAYLIPNTPYRRRLVVFERIDLPARQRKADAMGKHVVHIVESARNRRFKELKKLLGGRGLKKQGMAIVSGHRQVNEALKAFPDHCRAWISRGDRMPPPEDSPSSMDWVQLAAPLFAKLDLFGTGFPLLLFEPLPIGKWMPSDGFADGCTLLLPFQDPENVGAAIRSAAAFGAGRVVLLAECAHPFHPKAIRASAGAVLSASLFHGPSIKDLPVSLPVIPLSMEGRPIHGYTFPGAFGLLAGVEGGGLPEQWRGRSVSIPTTGAVESLNAAAAVAVALYEWSRGR